MIIVDISVEDMTPFVMWAYAKIPSPQEKNNPASVIRLYFYHYPNTATFYSSVCIKPGKRTDTYLCVRGINVPSFYDIRLWRCSSTVVLFVFPLIVLTITKCCVFI